MIEGKKNNEFRKIRIFEHNSVLNYYSTVKKFHMRQWDLSTKKPFSAIFEFQILRGKIAKFRKFGFSNITRLLIAPWQGNFT